MTEYTEETVQTQYGETIIKTYDCDSCGNTVPYEETVQFTIGNREGRACEICEDEGPVSFPRKVVNTASPIQEQGDVLAVFAWPLTSLIGVLAAESDWGRGYLIASVGAWFWILMAILTLFLL